MAELVEHLPMQCNAMLMQALGLSSNPNTTKNKKTLTKTMLLFKLFWFISWLPSALWKA
jgi:hypothetical protein